MKTLENIRDALSDAQERLDYDHRDDVADKCKKALEELDKLMETHVVVPREASNRQLNFMSVSLSDETNIPITYRENIIRKIYKAMIRASDE